MGGCTQPDSALGLKADITTVPEPNTWGYGFDDGEHAIRQRGLPTQCELTYRTQLQS
jgi:hypothetical protein